MTARHLVPIKVRHVTLDPSAPTGRTRDVHETAKVCLVPRSELGGATWPYADLPRTHTYNPDWQKFWTLREIDKGGGKVPNPALDLSSEPYWLLVVSGQTPDGKPEGPVAQRLQFSVDDKGNLAVTPGWEKPAVAKVKRGDTEERKREVRAQDHPDANLLAATVEPIVQQVTYPNAPPERTWLQLAVDLYPRREVVMLAGTEYAHWHGTDPVYAGTQIWRYAFARRQILLRDEVIDEGSLVTILCCDDYRVADHHRTNVKLTYVKAHGSGKGAQWLEVARQATWGGWRPYFEHLYVQEDSPGTYAEDLPIGAPDLYLHLASAPARTVIETSVFGHSYFDGPILYNTNERTGYKTNSEPRDPKDLDLRWKDWKPSSWPHVPSLDHDALNAAFAAGATLRLWGCNVSFWTLRKIRDVQLAYRKKPAEDTFAEITFDWDDAPAEMLHSTALHVLRDVVYRIWAYNPAYCEHANQVLTSASRAVGCFASPPGMEANFGTEKGSGLNVMWINPNGYPVPKDKKPPDYSFHGLAFDFYGHRFPTLTRNESNYLDYGQLGEALRKVASKTPPFYTQRYGRVHLPGDTSKLSWRLPTGACLFFEGKGIPTGAKIKLRDASEVEVEGLGAAGSLSGHVYYLRNAKVQVVTRYSFTRPLSRVSWSAPKVMLGASAGDYVGALVQPDGEVYLLAGRDSRGRKFTLDVDSIGGGLLQSADPTTHTW